MKLKLEYLAPYLPYGLKIENSIGKITELGLADASYHLDKGFKPILRPLSDCYEYEHLEVDLKEFVQFGKWSDSNDDFLEHLYDSHYDFNVMNKAPYEIMIFFIKHHFDVFGLIDKGLAIDINTL